jgi:hypothetical protein
MTIRTNPKTPDACSYGYWSCRSLSEERPKHSSLFYYHHDMRQADPTGRKHLPHSDLAGRLDAAPNMTARANAISQRLQSLAGAPARR